MITQSDGLKYTSLVRLSTVACDLEDFLVLKKKMGNLLRLLSREEGTCFSPQRYDLFLDFESVYYFYTILSVTQLVTFIFYQMPNLQNQK